jgi:beta-N-acetylhexosaminidase
MIMNIIEIQKTIDKMSIEEKVGQCLVIGFVGTVITPSIIERIKRIKPAGVRVGLTFRSKSAVYDPYAYNEEFLDRVLRNPKGTVKDFQKDIPVPYCTNEEYCDFLNTLKTASLENDAEVPLHITFDMEGDASADYFRGGVNYLPSQMGIGETGNKQFAYDAAWAVGRQLAPIGFSWIHSPVLDVNTNPLNPEIGIRSFSENSDKATEFAIEALKGYQDAKIITTGKHFPGRGASNQDAHGGLPVIDISREELNEHLKPFKALIDAGLPSIMTAHTAYPALDPSGLPATLSKVILTDLLKDELGFKGVITTDDITMGGIVEKFEVHEACIMAINAGADLILFRDESTLIDEVFPLLVNAVKSGVISEERLNEAVTRTLSVKHEYGLFENGALKERSEASQGINDVKVKKIIKTLAKETVSILRDEQQLLPLKATDKVLLVEQVHPLHRFTNDQKCHPGLLWEKMFKYSSNVGMVETSMDFDADSRERVMKRAIDADIIVITNYHFRRYENGNGFVKELLELGKPLVVITNSPYSFTLLPDYKTVVMNYGASPESFEEVAALLFKG